MAKLAIGELSASEILAASKNPGTRTYLSYTGTRPKRVVGGAAPWKGMSIDNIRKSFPRVANGVETAAKLSRAHTERGMCAVAKATGGVTICPTKCGMMMEDAGTGKIIRRSGSIDALIQQGLVSVRA